MYNYIHKLFRIPIHCLTKVREAIIGVTAALGRMASEVVQKYVSLPYIFIYLIGRAGASPPSRATGLNFLYYMYIYMYIYIRSSSTLRMRALRANVKPAHCKFKGRTFSANFS